MDPISAAVVIKEAAEKTALAVKETLKLAELAKEGIKRLKIRELFKSKELSPNALELAKENYKHLHKKISEAKENAELRAPTINQLMDESNNLKGQMGEFHADQYFSRFGEVKRQLSVTTERGQFRVDFDVRLKKNMPIKSFTMKDGILKSRREVIRAGERMGVEIKNGPTELYQNPEHVINQALAAKEVTGNGCIGINQSMLETVSKNPDLYADLFTRAAEHDIRIIVTQPTISQQIGNITSLI